VNRDNRGGDRVPGTSFIVNHTQEKLINFSFSTDIRTVIVIWKLLGDQRPRTGQSSQLMNNVSGKENILTTMGYRTQNKRDIYNPQNYTLQRKLNGSKLFVVMRTVCESKTEPSAVMC
jgi:hypothetical protein